MSVRCAMCGYRLSEATSKPNDYTQLLLCTNCGRAYAKIDCEGELAYRYLGMTQGNNEVREILNLEEHNERNAFD